MPFESRASLLNVSFELVDRRVTDEQRLIKSPKLGNIWVFELIHEARQAKNELYENPNIA